MSVIKKIKVQYNANVTNIVSIKCFNVFLFSHLVNSNFINVLFYLEYQPVFAL